MSLLKRFLASLSLLSFFLNPLAAYAVMIPQGDIVNTPTLLSASDYGITEPATEIPSERTLRTATFDLGNGKRAQVSVDANLFTKHPQYSDQIVFASNKGVKNGNSFSFDYLPQDTRVSFDLTKPSYTLTKGTHSFTLSFPTQSSIAGTILNDHQVSYPLSENATLIWTVEGTNVKKEIFVKNNGTAHFEFVIDSNLVKTLSDNAVILSDGSKEIFRTEKPYLLTTTYSPLLNPVSLIQNTEGNYEYVYDESLLPQEYVLDPSAGPNSGSTFTNDASIGTTSWTSLSNLSAADDSYAQYIWEATEVDPGGVNSCTTGSECASGTCAEWNSMCTAFYTSGPASKYVKATGFNFSIPNGSTIDGIKTTWEIGYGGYGFDQNASRIVKGGTIGSTNKTGSQVDNHPGDMYSDVILDFGGASDLWGLSWTVADINASTFGTALSVKGPSGYDGTSNASTYVEADHVGITVYYTYTPVDCYAPVECGTTTYGCVGGVCQGCTQNSECASGSCNTETGECQGDTTGVECSTDSNCLSGSCVDGFCRSVCGSTCGSVTFPSGIGLMKQSDNQVVAFSSLSTTSPTKVWIVKTSDNSKIASLSLIRKPSGGLSCDFSDLVADTNSTSYAAILHDTDNLFEFGTSGRAYSLLVPKSASHDRIRVCSGKTTIGCTSSNSWSFLASDAGSIVSTNGGFNTTGITVSVSGGYWVITGMTGTGGQGESSGGGTTGGGDVPEFSTYALLIVIGGCYLFVRKAELA